MFNTTIKSFSYYVCGMNQVLKGIILLIPLIVINILKFIAKDIPNADIVQME